MIIAWMCAALLFAACVAVAAHTTARLAQWAQRPTRLVWSAALAVAVCWPLLVPVLRAVPLAQRAVTAGPTGMAVRVDGVAMVAPVVPSAIKRVLDVLAPFGWVAFSVWAVVSALLLMRLLFAAFRLRQLTRRAMPAEVDGEPVLLAEWLGPASVGWRKPYVVLPRWVLTLDAPLRALVLRHEREHCRSGDPRVVWYAAIATAVVPWNPAVWWLARQLRLALELDCDARTLALGGDTQRYAKLLLFMSQQHAVPAARTTLALSLSRSTSQLSQRILAMQQRHRAPTRSARLLLGAVSVMALVAACNTDIPGTAEMPAAVVSSGERAAAVVTDSSSAAQPSVSAAGEPVAGEPYFEFQVDEPATMLVGSNRMTYPPVLRSAQVEGAVLMSFVVDTDGAADLSTLKVLRSDHPLFTNAVKQALAEIRYTPAKVDGQVVRQVVQQPFAFALGMKSAERLGETGGTTNVVQSLSNEPTKPKLTPNPGEPWFEFQVDVPAAMLPGTNTMTYPTTLREAGVQGSVLASFVLNTNGTADMSTFKVLRSDHELFTASVKQALPGIRYTPGEVKGAAVRQVVQQPFVFRLAR